MLDDENHSGNRRLSRRTILTGTALMAGAVATGGPTAAAYADDGMPPSTEEPLFDDHEFRYGLSLSATQTDLPAPGVNLFPVDGTEPRWRASQWGTRYTLADAKLRSYPAFPHMPGTSTGYANPGKRLIRGPHGELWVEVFGSAEYDHARLDGEPWPHLLVEQSWDANTFRLTDIKSLKFSIDVRVDHITNMMGDQYDPTRHAAQVTAYFTLVNTIAGSAGNGEMIWFGVPIVDNRYDIPPGYQAEDTGKPDASHQFIDTVDGHEFWDSSLQDWRWHRLRTDLQPYLINAYQTARDRGYLQSTALDDLHITSFNMGWEIPRHLRRSLPVQELQCGARVSWQTFVPSRSGSPSKTCLGTSPAVPDLYAGGCLHELSTEGTTSHDDHALRLRLAIPQMAGVRKA